MEELDDFRRRLESRYRGLTKSEQRIASYLLSSHDVATFLTAAELADRLNVSEATIVRFAKSVGYASFPDLRRNLQEIFRVRAAPATRMQRKLDDLKTGQGHVLQKTVEMELQYLAEVERSVDLEEFDRAVQIIIDGQRVFAFGMGPARLLADLVHLRLGRFGFPTFALTESGRDILEKLVLMKSGDAIVAMAFHTVTGELVSVLDYARTLGCRSVLLTDTLGATLKDKVDVVLSARRGPLSTFHSLTAPMVILNALILSVAMAKSEESLAALTKLEKLRAAYGPDGIGE